ncbi:MAG: metallophosphoesterase [Spirochaetes bacterium]|nr:metallophosphoesterase [Spirochaetota bacterium]
MDPTVAVKDTHIKVYLDELFDTAPVREFTSQDQVVVFSDLHMGNGGSKDDFRENADLFLTALREYYLPNQFLLILNGDIEEYQKFLPFQVRRAWEPVFLLFDEFARKGKLVQIWGNHDELLSLRPGRKGKEVHEALRLRYHGKDLFIFHGHQISPAYNRLNRVFGYIVRYLVRPLGIMNGSVAKNNKKKFKTEQKIYEYSTGKKILSIIGHTHRPLFESLSKVDVLKFQIEDLCRRYPVATGEEKERIASEVRKAKEKLLNLLESSPEEAMRGSIYESHFMVPSVFNSGSATGKGGITCLEIVAGNIRLVHWVDVERGKHHLDSQDAIVVPLKDTPYFKVILKEESLDYIFARIELL